MNIIDSKDESLQSRDESPLTEYIKNTIVKINIEKNNYAKKKVIGEVNVTKERELVSMMIYLISEIKYNTDKLGLGRDSICNLYSTANDLKSQVLTIVNSTPEKLRETINNKLQ